MFLYAVSVSARRRNGYNVERCHEIFTYSLDDPVQNIDTVGLRMAQCHWPPEDGWDEYRIGALLVSEELFMKAFAERLFAISCIAWPIRSTPPKESSAIFVAVAPTEEMAEEYAKNIAACEFSAHDGWGGYHTTVTEIPPNELEKAFPLRVC